MIQLERFMLGYPIRLNAQMVGKDVNIVIAGGSMPHIGAVTIAQWCNGRAKLTTWLDCGHRDDIISDMFARRVCEAMHVTVCVSCGIHYERPDRQQLERIVREVETMLEEFLHAGFTQAN